MDDSIKGGEEPEITLEIIMSRYDVISVGRITSTLISEMKKQLPCLKKVDIKVTFVGSI